MKPVTLYAYLKIVKEIDIVLNSLTFTLLLHCGSSYFILLFPCTVASVPILIMTFQLCNFDVSGRAATGADGLLSRKCPSQTFHKLEV